MRAKGKAEVSESGFGLTLFPVFRLSVNELNDKAIALGNIFSQVLLTS